MATYRSVVDAFSAKIEHKRERERERRKHSLILLPVPMNFPIIYFLANFLGDSATLSLFSLLFFHRSSVHVAKMDDPLYSGGRRCRLRDLPRMGTH